MLTVWKPLALFFTGTPETLESSSARFSPRRRIQYILALHRQINSKNSPSMQTNCMKRNEDVNIYINLVTVIKVYESNELDEVM